MASKRYLCAPLKNKPQYTLFSQLILQVFLSCPLINLILKSIRPEPNRISSTQTFEGLKPFTRMRLGLSHLADSKFRHNFQDCLNPICSCGHEIETTSHFLLDSPITIVQEKHFLKEITLSILIFYSRATHL